MATRPTAQSLAALSATLSRRNAPSNKNDVVDQALTVLALQMKAGREAVRARVAKRLAGLSAGHPYPLNLVLYDIRTYHYAGTLQGALDQVACLAKVGTLNTAATIDNGFLRSIVTAARREFTKRLTS